MMATEQKLITGRSPEEINSNIKKHLEEGWHTIGCHTSVQIRAQLQYSGTQHMQTIHHAEYAQTVARNINV